MTRTMPNPRRLTTPLWLSPEEHTDLRALAAQLGYYRQAGPGRGKLGSISALLRGIQSGELILLKKGYKKCLNPTTKQSVKP